MKHTWLISTHFILLVLTFLFYLPVSNAVAGDLTIELGDSVGPIPKGEYVDDLDKIEQLSDSLALKAPMIALKYTFDVGLTLGGETFGSSAFVTDERDDPNTSEEESVFENTDEYYLFIQFQGFTVGWTFGDVLRFCIETGVLGKASVSAKEKLTDMLSNGSIKNQSIPAQFYGIGLDWGFMKNDGSGLGIVVYLRQASLETNDLFGSDKDFDASNTYFSGALRYRF